VPDVVAIRMSKDDAELCTILTLYEMCDRSRPWAKSHCSNVSCKRNHFAGKEESDKRRAAAAETDAAETDAAETDVAETDADVGETDDVVEIDAGTDAAETNVVEIDDVVQIVPSPSARSYANVVAQNPTICRIVNNIELIEIIVDPHADSTSNDDTIYTAVTYTDGTEGYIKVRKDSV
jgi:hypothetical protein